MPKVLTAERIASYRANGYLYPNDALSAAEVVHYREELRMPACLVRGKDEYGHFDLQPRPQQDFGPVETERHDQTFKAYLESFYEQLGFAEKVVPAGIAALAP